MNGNASVNICILTAVVHWLRRWSDRTEIAGSRPVIGRHLPFYFLFYDMQTALLPCELEFTRFMIKSCVLKKHCRQTIASVLFTPYIRICLLMRNQNTHKTHETQLIQ